MRTLVIDTATRACSVALYEGGAILASHHEVIGRGHAERLLPLIASLPQCGAAAQVLVDVGPGSFTGIRVGVAAARALGLAWNVPVHGYGCLSLVAAMAREHCGRAVDIDVVMTGGHGEYFFQTFDGTGQSSAEAISLSPEMLAEKAHTGTVAGDHGGDLSEMLGAPIMLDILPNASYWRLIAGLPLLPASPVYGRAPDALAASGKPA